MAVENRNSSLLSRLSCVLQSTHPAPDDEGVVTVRSNEYWIASTQAPCFSCIRLATVQGLIFPAGSAIGGHEQGAPRPVLASDDIKYFQLIYVRRISAPTLADIVQFHVDYDERLDCR